MFNIYFRLKHISHFKLPAFSVVVISTLLISVNVFSQTSTYRGASLKDLEKARARFADGRINAARPLLQHLYSGYLSLSDDHNPIAEELLYMLSVVQLLQDDSEGEENAEMYFKKYQLSLNRFRLAFEAGNYFFRRNEYSTALTYYEMSDVSQLTNKEVALMKFRQAYSYFQQRMFSSAKPLFNTIRQLSSDPYYADANYYYGYICYAEKTYKEALESFEKIKDHASYSKVVPYYIASINYIIGQKEKSIKIAEAALKRSDLFFRPEMNQLLGHAYFEQKDFKKAEPLLESYYKQSSKVTREQLYELSYCYYSNEKLTAAADGFKQLSEGADSLSQDAMFLLGDVYLRTGNKVSARNAFAFCSGNSSNIKQREIAKFFYAKLSADLGYQGIAISELSKYIADYSQSTYSKEAKELLASLLGNTSNYKDAIALLESLDELSESTKKLYPRLLYGRAVELMNDQQFQKAEILLEQVLGDANGMEVHPFAHFWKGEIQYKSGNINTALSHFQKFIASGATVQGQPGITEGNYQVGYCYYRLQKFDLALSSFQKLIDKPVSGATILQQDAYLRQADCHYMLRKFSLAQDMYQQVIDRSWARSDYAIFQKARIVGITKPDQKINLLLQLQKQHPSSGLVTEADMEIADTYLSDEKFREAIPYLQKVSMLKVSSLRAPALFRLGTSYYNLDKDDDALSSLQLLLKDYPSSTESSDALVLVKTIYIEKGAPLEYEAYLKKSGRTITELEADSLSYQALQIKIDNKDCAGVLEQSAGYLKRFPQGIHSEDVKYQRSLCFQQAKDWTNALNGFETVATGNASQLTEYASLYGARIAYFELQEIKRAAVLYEKLYQSAGIADNKTEALRGMIRCYYKLKDYESGQIAADQLLLMKTSGNDDKALSHLVNGYIFYRKGLADQALQSFRQTVQYNKGEWSAEARYQISKILFYKKEYGQSEKAAFEVINKNGSYEFWVAKAYLLLGDIYFEQKDYFNAKATYQSVSDNVSIAELSNEALEKLKLVAEAEKNNSKVK